MRELSITDDPVWHCFPGPDTTFGEMERAINDFGLTFNIISRDQRWVITLCQRTYTNPPPSAAELAHAMFGGLEGVLISEDSQKNIAKGPVHIPDTEGR